MTATTTPQERLFQLSQSVSKEHSELYTSDALPTPLFHFHLLEKPERPRNVGVRMSLLITPGRMSHSSDMPHRFTGDADDYPQRKSEIQNWVSKNEAEGTNVITTDAVVNLHDRDSRWHLFEEIGRYGMIDGVPVSAPDALKAIFADTDALAADTRTFENAGQGTKDITEHNRLFLHTALEAGYDPESSRLVLQYTKSLRRDLRKRMERWRLKQKSRGKQVTLADCMRKAAGFDANFSTRNKRANVKKRDRGKGLLSWP